MKEYFIFGDVRPLEHKPHHGQSIFFDSFLVGFASAVSIPAVRDGENVAINTKVIVFKILEPDSEIFYLLIYGFTSRILMKENDRGADFIIFLLHEPANLNLLKNSGTL
jgi:hypothetical protein